MMQIIYSLAAIIIFAPTLALASCLSHAAIRWNVPEIILDAIISQESNWQPNAKNNNTNGSQDYGLMQINSVNINSLKSAGIIKHKEMLMQPCINIQAGAYLLSLKFKKYGYGWYAVGAYHSETIRHRDKYASLIMKIVRTKADLPHQKIL